MPHPPNSLDFRSTTGRSGSGSTASTSAAVTVVEDLVEAQSLVYMSPEAISDPRKVTEASDVFSLGAIAFHLFASRPPASNVTDLSQDLEGQKGLSISSVLDGAGPKLEELIQWSTHPDVLTRIGSVEDFLTLLDRCRGRTDRTRPKPSSPIPCRRSGATVFNTASSWSGCWDRERQPRPCS